MKPAIEIRNMGKEYKLASSQPYVTLRDVIAGSIKNFFRAGRKQSEKFWALQNIDLDIQPGERVGIIGRNGAGKSTLLKIISRITTPTTGKAIIRGRVGSLLEVGTGFHNELTGRENIYLNGSILGLKKAEINKQLDAIIDFSGVEKFIDTPLKHYSSGMQLRLAFSVAAHLEPEILLIDEVLAVGDMEFQKKCVTKMEDISHSGDRTIVFVSHNLAHLKQLCNKAILLDAGKVISKGEVHDVIARYNQLINSSKMHSWTSGKNEKDFNIAAIEILSSTVNSNEKNFIRVTVSAKKRIENSIIALRYTNQDQVHVLTTSNADFSLNRETIEQGTTVYNIPLPLDILTPGHYSIEAAWIIPHVEQLDNVVGKIVFEVQNDKYAGHVLQDGRLEVVNKIIRWEKC